MPTTPLRRLTIALAIAFAGAATPAHAATIYRVNSMADSPDASVADSRCLTAYNECTLRAAIQQANATANLPDDPDQIVIDLGGRMELTGQLPAISTAMDIRGPGPDLLTLWGNAQERVLSISTPVRVRISGMTIAHGSATTGGGIANSIGDLTITDCVISGNIASAGGGISSFGGALTIVRTNVHDNNAMLPGAREIVGGGLYAYLAHVEVVDSTFHNNGAFRGGGIFDRDGDVNATGSTFSGNVSSTGGGAIANADGSVSLVNTTMVANSALNRGGAIENFGDLRVRNSTIAGNSAPAGGGIFTADFTVLRNALVARNSAPAGPDLAGFESGDVQTDGGNLVGNAAGVRFIGTGGSADQVGTAAAPIDPKLELELDGAPRLRSTGPTETVAPLPGSPAIDRGIDAAAPETDQRGAPRRRGAHVDVGAYESPDQAPVHGVPDDTQYTGEDTPLVFSAGNAISVSDPDYAGSAPATTTLSVPDGSGTLAIAGTPAGVSITGAGTEKVTLSGPPAAIAEALDGLRFTPAPDANGPLTLSVKTSDNGDGTPDSAATDADDVAIVVRAANDPPRPSDDALGENARVIPFTALLANDAAGPANESRQKLTVTAVGDAEGGKAELSPSGIAFTPAPGYTGRAGFAYEVQDDGQTNDEDDPRAAKARVHFDVTADSPAEPTIVVPDTVAPVVTRVHAMANVFVDFSEALDPRTVTRRTVALTRAGRSVKATVRYDASRHRVVIDPRRRLAAGARYVVTVRGVKDLAGNAPARTGKWSFATRR